MKTKPEHGVTDRVTAKLLSTYSHNWFDFNLIISYFFLVTFRQGESASTMSEPHMLKLETLLIALILTVFATQVVTIHSPPLASSFLYVSYGIVTCAT